MTLIELKKYMMTVRSANLFNISTYFNTEPDLVRCQLQHWMNKGCVVKSSKTANCGSKCGKCAAITTEIYQWVSIVCHPRVR